MKPIDSSSAAQARDIAYYFGQVADTLEWERDAWMALSVKLSAMGKPASSLTLADVAAAIAAVNAEAEGGEA